MSLLNRYTHQWDKQGRWHSMKSRTLQSHGIHFTELKITLRPYLTWIRDFWQRVDRSLVKDAKTSTRRKRLWKQRVWALGTRALHKYEALNKHIQNGSCTMNSSFKPRELAFREKKAAGTKWGTFCPAGTPWNQIWSTYVGQHNETLFLLLTIHQFSG